MEVNDPIVEAAQDDTAPAADGQQQGAEALAQNAETMPSLIDQAAEPGQESAEQPAAAPGGDTLLDKLNGGGEGEEAAEAEDAAAEDGEAYALTFPEGVVADPEAVKVLNEVGKEFGVTGEKAQALATAATEYATRQVQQTMDRLESGFMKFREEQQKATLAAWGDKAKEYGAEAAQGLRQMQKAGVIPADLHSNINTKVLCDMGWFLDLCRDYRQRNSEQPGIMSDRGGQEAGNPAKALFPGI